MTGRISPARFAFLRDLRDHNDRVHANQARYLSAGRALDFVAAFGALRYY